ncbi:aminoacyl--tRNA ligase-related protein [Streptomyces sp. NPDC007205]|uniref:aminoacyl--tRNA ligase-related protein n=1 Tax=Streptomyces sp. NPDC007205 TaxID=3154316 RepID=UPI00340C779A
MPSARGAWKSGFRRVRQAGCTAGRFPEFADDVFVTDRAPDGRAERFLLPTAETALAALHHGETLDERELPLKYVSCTPCYRKEAGGHRTAERGTLRGHQFNKVELFQLARPADSGAARRELLGRAEELVAGLGLHYRVTRLAAGDTGSARASTYDVESGCPAWAPTRRSARCRTPATTRPGAAASGTARPTAAERRTSTS